MSAIQLVAPLDMSKSPVEILVAKYNAINGLAINPNDVSLSAVTTVADAEYNTSVQLIPNANSIWMTNRPLYYRRTPIAEVTAVPAEVKTSGNEYLYQILDAINIAYGINLREADVQDATIQYSDPANRASPGTVQLNTRASSYFYTASTTLTVNTPHRLGNNLYENEMAFLVVESPPEGNDVINIIDIYGQPVTDITLFKGMTITTLKVVDAWVWPDKTITVIGRIEVTENGQPAVYRSVTMDQRGNILVKRAGSVYGLNRPGAETGLTFYPDKDTGQVYCLDPNNIIGGKLSQLHRYNADGTYDTTFPDVVNTPISSLAITASRLYLSYVTSASQLSVGCLEKATLTPPTGWSTITVSTPNITKASRLSFDQFGVRVHYDKSSPIDNFQTVVNNETIDTLGVKRPSFALSFDGNGKLRSDWKRRRNSVWSFINRFYPTEAVAQDFTFMPFSTGSSLMAMPQFMIAAIDEEGNYHCPQHGTFGNYPMFYANPPKLMACPNADILAIGSEMLPAIDELSIALRQTITVFASTGRFAARLYMANAGRTIKKVLVMLGDESV